MNAELIEQLQAGVCLHKKGWCGYTEVGRLDEAATNELMARAADEIERLKPLEGTDDHCEHRCDKCGGRNIHSWYADSDVWNQVADKHSILCPICFSELAKDAGMQNVVWRLSISGDDPELSKLRVRLHERMEEMAESWKEIERLQVVVDKLPKTADGVPVVPGMQVFVIWTPYLNGPLQTRDCEGTVPPDSLATVRLTWRMSGGTLASQVMDVSGCYSTREAAQAAIKQQQPEKTEGES